MLSVGGVFPAPLYPRSKESDMCTNRSGILVAALFAITAILLPDGQAAASAGAAWQVEVCVKDLARLRETDIGPVFRVMERVRDIPQQPALEALCVFLGGADPKMRRAAVHILGHIAWDDPAPAHAPLRELLGHTEALTRGMTVLALGSTGDKASRDKISEMLAGDNDPYVRQCAAWALGELADTQAIEALRKAASDQDKYVAMNAANALERFDFLASLPVRSRDVPAIKAVWMMAGTSPTGLERMRRIRELSNTSDPRYRAILYSRLLGSGTGLLAVSREYVPPGTGRTQSWRESVSDLYTISKTPSQSIKNAAVLLSMLNNEGAPLPAAEDEVNKKLAIYVAQVRDIWGDEPVKRRTTPLRLASAERNDSAARIAKALESPISIEFDGEHISNILRFLTEYTGINIALDNRVVAAQGKEPNEGQVSDGIVNYIKLSDVKLKDALQALLRPLNLACAETEGFIWVSTPPRKNKKRIV